MAQIEAKTVLARLIQRFDFQLLSANVGLRMGATLEPQPMRMQVMGSHPKRAKTLSKF
jgi:cytochrome P450